MGLNNSFLFFFANEAALQVATFMSANSKSLLLKAERFSPVQPHSIKSILQESASPQSPRLLQVSILMGVVDSIHTVVCDVCEKYVSIPSEKYFYVHLYVCICVYTYLCKMDERRSYASLS